MSYYSKNKVSFLIFILTFSIFSIVDTLQILDYEDHKKIDPSTTSQYVILGDEPNYVILTSVIIHHHSIFMDDYFLDRTSDRGLTLFESYYHNLDSKPFLFQRSDGHYVSLYGPGLSYLLVPGYALGGIFGAFVTMSIISSLTSVFIFKFASSITNPKIAFLTSLIFSFSSLLFTYSDQIYSDVVTTFILISSLYFVFQKSSSGIYMSITGAILGFAILLKISAIMIDVVLIPVVIILFLKQRVPLRNFVLFFIFFILLMVIAGINNLYSVGSFSGKGTLDSVLDVIKGNGQGMYSVDNQKWMGDELIEIFFGEYHGLFIFSPVVTLFVLGIIPLWKKNQLLLVTISLLSASFIFGYTWINPISSLAAGDPPFRYFIPIIPLLALLFSAGFEKFSSSKIYKILVLILTSIGFYIILALAFSPKWMLIALNYEKGRIIHIAFQQLDFLFPVLGPGTGDWGLFAPTHSLTTSNVVFLVVFTFLLVFGAIFPIAKNNPIKNK